MYLWKVAPPIATPTTNYSQIDPLVDVTRQSYIMVTPELPMIVRSKMETCGKDHTHTVDGYIVGESPCNLHSIIICSRKDHIVGGAL